MNIDMFYVWIMVIASTLLFQNAFTERRTTWDVSYAVENTDQYAYGQTSLSSWGSNLSWRTARAYLEEDVMKERSDKIPVTVVILAINKDSDKRFFRPFWKHVSWYK